MSRGTVLSLCDRTGNMVAPWAEAGFACYCLDVRHENGTSALAPGVTAIGVDVLAPAALGYLRAVRPRIVFAFPPCTHLAASGARWWKDKGLKAIIDGLTLVERCRELCEVSGAPWMLENPVGSLSTYWRKPDWSFDPCDYGGYLDPPGDAYTKRTNLWVGGGFVLPDPKPVFPVEGSKIHRMSSSWADERAVTPMGFARAVFEANVGRVTASAATA
jgi:hypothetical protein